MELDDPLRSELLATVEKMLAEDIGDGDLTAELIPADKSIVATVITREAATLAGRPWVDEIYGRLDATVRIEWLAADGDMLAAGDTVCTLRGSARSILTGERAALNILQTLCATATVTAAYARELSGTACKVLDTRKTLPGLRRAQKYAVRCGGGVDHRVGLFDAILIKENHIASAGGIAPAIAAARAAHPDLPVEIEVESSDELREALASAAERVLLDNFSNEELRDAVAINRDEGNPPAELEASGNLSLESVRAVAETGVDYVSVGALTKNIDAIDLSMRFE